MPRNKGDLNREKINDSDLEITPVESGKRKKILKNNYYDLNLIPNHPAKVMFCGASKSGKSTLIINLLIKDVYYANYFHNIFVFSPNSYVDENFEALRKHDTDERVQFIDDLDSAPEMVQQIINAQKQIIQHEGIENSPRLLIILDDFIDNKKLVNHKILQQLFTQGRHDNISTWVSVQAYNACPLKCRKQLNNIIAFSSPDEREIDSLLEHKHRDISKEDFIKLFDMATKEPYSFMHINLDLRGEDDNKRYRKKFFEVYTIHKK